MTSLRSPKRRRVLSSFNPDEDHNYDHHEYDPRAPSKEAAPTLDTAKPSASTTPPETSSSTAPRPSKFRFKSERHSRTSRHEKSKTSSSSHHEDHHSHRSSRRHHHPSDPSRPRRHHRSHRSHSPTPPPKPDPFQPSTLDPESAFRESLFDALADDEGAAYWESVYGQPIHIYEPPSRPGPDGELERMTDEEYAAHVRQKMWEKTHAGLVEERERRKREKEERAKKREEEDRVEREMERALRRGEERRRRGRWRGGWESYIKGWEEWDGGEEGIPWPVLEVGEKVRDGEGVRKFFVEGLGLEEVGEREFAKRLKEERVRWHPDKMQQRLGGKVDEVVMKDVTKVFQVVDGLWNDVRKKDG